MPEGYCAKIYGRLGMTANHSVHLAGGVSIIDPDFRGPISICLHNLHICKPYKIKVNNHIGQMMIEKVEERMTLRSKECLKMHLRAIMAGREIWRASEVQEFE